MTSEQELGTSMKCIKYMFFVVNLMFVLVGLLLILIGCTVKTIYSDYDQFIVAQYYSASNLAIAVGALIFVISLFGCFGAIKQSVCLINMYTLLLFCVLILEITVIGLAYSLRTRIVKEIEWNMYETLDSYDTTTGYIWNATQYSLRCCGVRSPKDWYSYQDKYQLKNITREDDSAYYKVPETCCRDETCKNWYSVYKVGCFEKVLFIISESALLLGIGAMSVACIQMLGIIFANILAKSVRRLKTQMLVEQTERRQQAYEQLARAQGNSTEKSSPVLYEPASSDA